MTPQASAKRRLRIADITAATPSGMLIPTAMPAAAGKYVSGGTWSKRVAGEWLATDFDNVFGSQQGLRRWHLKT
jgi:hypothetical protein